MNKNFIVPMQTYKILIHLPFIIFLLFISQNTQAQTIFDSGDIAIVGVNANNSACTGGFGGEDLVTFVAFKDITNNTQIDMTDNGWERTNVNQWGDSEGTYRFTRTGGTIPAGTSIDIIFITDAVTTQAANPGWTVTNLNVPSTLIRNINFNSGGDQLYIMQNGNWNNGGETGEHDAVYTGDILYGFNTRTTWSANGSSQQSNLHPEVTPCFFMNPTGGTTNYVNYTGPTTAATQQEWIQLIENPANWSTYTSCAAYNNSPPPSSLTILPSEMSIDCTICTGGCGAINETLTFNLPSSGGPFDVTYTDGTSTFTLTDISDGHTETVNVSSNTTFSLVSVVSADGCPTFSNFSGDAVITFSGTGGGAMASISGGDVLCSGSCTTVTVNVSGGTPPYNLTANFSLPPFSITIPNALIPNTNFVINVCSQAGLPGYNAGTNTVTIPPIIFGNGSITLVSITDASGCAGTVDPTPLAVIIETTPTASSESLSACAAANGMATFDLTSVNSTVNGGNGNTVSWFTDLATNNQINNPTSYTSGSTTVYAVSSTANCDSDPASVQLTVNPSPTANPASLEICSPSSIGNFDLTSLNSMVNGGNANTVNWFSNSAGTAVIGNSSNYSSSSGIVYASVTANGCASSLVPVTLTISPQPTGVPTSLTECESTIAPTFADFDLNTINNIVNGGSGATVNWFLNVGLTIPIATGNLAAQTNTTVYAQIGTAPCTSGPVAVTLIVTPVPTANPSSLSACAQIGNQAVFDLTSVDNSVNGTSGNAVNWFSDSNGNSPIATPNTYISGSTIVYASVSVGSCTSALAPVTLTVIAPPTANNNVSATSCDLGGGFGSFDLTTIANNVNSNAGNTVTWFSDMNGNNSIASPYFSMTATVYAIVSNGVCSSAPTAVSLTVTNAPTVNTASAELCDSGNGTATFNLTNLENTINGGSGDAVSWFSDMAATMSIPSSYNTTSTIVYAVVNTSGCSSTPVAINLTVTNAPTANTASADECDSVNGTATFNLTNLENTVNGGSANTVTWFSDMAATMSILSSYNTTSTTVYAVVSSGGCSSQPVAISLTVTNAPTANTASAEACDSGNGTATFNLTNLENTVNGGSGNTVTWFSDMAAMMSIPSSYNTTSTIVYAVVSSGSCASLPVAVTLTTVSAPTANNNVSATSCDLGGGFGSFDLAIIANDINSNTGNTVTWFSDINGNAQITTIPYFTTSTIIYAIVSDGTCSSIPTEVTLTVTNAPTANTASADECDSGNGTADFNLTNLENTINDGNGDGVTWFSDMAATMSIPSLYNTTSTTVYAVVTSNGCTSTPVAISLTVTSAPTANTASSEECDSGNGTADFNLTNLENTVNGGSGNTVTWYSDMGATMSIPSLYNTTSTTVYAVVESGLCTSSPVAIMLTVGNSPTANTASSEECDSGNGTADFNLTNLENTINGGSGNTVTWYSDMGATMSIPSLYNTTSTTVYAVVGSGVCTSSPVAVMLTVGSSPTANTASAQECDSGNGTADFDLTNLESAVNGNSGNTVTWYSDMAATLPIASLYNTTSTSVYAVVGSGNCISSSVAVMLTVDALQTAFPVSSDICDDGTGTANFDLTNLEGTVNGGSGSTVTWYSDMAATFPIPSLYNTTSTIVYAVVGSGVCASAPVAVDLNVLPIPITLPAFAAECGSSTGLFDLTALENTVNGGTTNTVTWFSDMMGNNQIISPYVTTLTTVYAMVSNGTCTSALQAVDLEVLVIPDAIPSMDAQCDLGDGTANFDLNALANLVNDGTGATVLWYTDLGLVNQILNLNYNSLGETIFAIVDNGDCVSDFVGVTLSVTNNINANTATLDACDDGTGNATGVFDLASIENTINGGNGNMVTWYSDINATMLLTPPFTNYISTNASIYATVTSGSCSSDPVEITLTVSQQVDAFPTSTELCGDVNNEAEFDLTTLENTVNGGSGVVVNWFEDANANNAITSTSSFNTVTTTVYTIVGSGGCSSNPVAVDLTVNNTPTGNAITEFACDTGNGTGNFFLAAMQDQIVNNPNDTTLWFTQTMTPISGGPYNSITNQTIFVIVSNGTCESDFIPVELIVNDAVVATPTIATECADANGLADFDLIDLANIVNGGNGLAVSWFENSDGTMPITNTIVNAANITIYAAIQDGNCASGTVEVQLNVANQLPATPTADAQCDNGNGTATFDLTTLENTINGGSATSVLWYEDMNLNISITTPTNFTTTPTIIYAVVSDGGCTSAPVAIDLSISPQPTGNTITEFACDTGNGTGDFFLAAMQAQIINNPGDTVLWFTQLMNPITGGPVNSITNQTIFAVVFDGVCNSDPIPVTLIVDNAVTANPTDETLCEDGTGGAGMATFDLVALANIVNGGNGLNVNWFEDSNGNVAINTSTLTTMTTVVYAAINDGSCTSNIVQVSLNVNNAITANPTSGNECNQGNGMATFDLNALTNIVNGGNGNTVNWYSDMAATNLIPLSYATASTLVYAIVTDGICTSAPIAIPLNVNNAISVTPIADAQCDTGNGMAIFDLDILANTITGGNGNNVTWYSDMAATNPISSPYMSSAGSVYIIVDDGTCFSNITEIELNVETSPTATPTSDAQCDEGNGIATFDLDALANIVNGGSGSTVTWFSDINATNPISSSFSTASTTVYAVVGTGNCASTPVAVDLTTNTITTNDITQTLCAGESITVNGMVYDETNDSGTETTIGANGCDSTITVDLTFEPEVTGSIAVSANSICPGADLTLTFTLVGATAFDVQYSDGGTPITLSGISNGHTITLSPTTTTTYSILEIEPLNSNCNSVFPTSQVMVQVQTINAIAQTNSQYGNFNVSCFGASDGSVLSAPMTGTAPFTYQWNDGNITPLITMIPAGIYTVTITDATGCTTTATTELTQPDEIIFDIESIAPPCNDALGQITLSNISGGVGDFSSSLDSSSFSAVQNDIAVFDFVESGVHIVAVSDNSGCVVTEEVQVLEPAETTIDLGPDQTIQLGDSLELQPMTNFTPTEIIWSSSAPCLDCTSQFVTPTFLTEYIVTMYDENGCEAIDTINIRVEKERNVFIPNAFSPDDNGVNDIFYINAGQDVAEVKRFVIFSRWGEVMFSQENFQPNDPSMGWDGFFKNQRLNPGVFVYMAEIEFKDGFIEIYKGDVTLDR